MTYPAAVRTAAQRRGLTPAAYTALKDAGFKWCRNCKEWRPLTDYKPSTSTRDGVRPLCTRHYTPRPEPDHGLTRYRNYNCRCTTCRAANTAHANETRATRMARPNALDNVTHGKTSTYSNYGCRCQPCTKANSASSAQYKRKQRNSR